MPDILSITMVNHVALQINASPDRVWRVILDDYVEQKALRKHGTVEPIDDPAAAFGGFRTRFEQNGAVQEQIIHITERDDAARRLSLMVDYLPAPGGIRVYATYHARETDGGTCYTIDCHTQAPIETPAGGTRTDVSHALTGMTAAADAHMLAYLQSVKARLEGGN